MGKKPIVSVTYENERISIKNSLPYLKCVLRLSCVVHGSIYGRFMGFYVNGFLSKPLSGSAREGSGIPVYPKKIRQNTQKYPKFIQIYPKLYPGILYT